SAIACFIATWFQAPPCDRKRIARRSTKSVGSSVGLPQTWHLKPCSAKSGDAEMPDFASRSDAVTSAASLPMEETIPRPVTTTLLIQLTFLILRCSHAVKSAANLMPKLLGNFVFGKTNTKVGRLIDG